MTMNVPSIETPCVTGKGSIGCLMQCNMNMENEGSSMTLTGVFSFRFVTLLDVMICYSFQLLTLVYFLYCRSRWSLTNGITLW